MLKAIYDTQDDIPEQYRELFAQKGEKWELTGISGVKTQADIDRLKKSLETERSEHKATKAKLGEWRALGELPDVTAKLDKLPALEAAQGGKLDDAKLAELAQKQADGIVASKLAPVERELRQIKTKNEELTAENGQLKTAAQARARDDAIRPLLTELGVRPEHHDDALLYGSLHLERTEDGSFVSKDGVSLGLTPGLDPKMWLTELLDKKPGWRPGSKGGGATGGGGAAGGSNPWSKENWNVTKQGEYLKTHGIQKAEAAAKAAGSKVGATAPASS